MSLDNDAIAQEAGAAIAENGVTAYLVKKVTARPSDPFADPNEEPFDISDRIQAIYLQWKSHEMREGGLIRQGDRKVLVSATSLMGMVPKIGDGFRETPGGPTYRIVDPLTALAPNGEPLLYTLNVRL